MSRFIWTMAFALLPLGMDVLSAQTCEEDGTVKFVCGTTNPEDLYRVPNTPWVIASGRYSPAEGPVYAVDVRDHSVREIFPAGAMPPRHDRETYRACPGPNTVFQPHGLTLREGPGRVHTLYVVGHGAREAIEVFELDVGGALPTMTWIGCIPAPEGTRRMNSVTALPGGYLGATNFDPAGGEVWEWHPATGWLEVPGSQMRGPNGLVSSDDGRWLYIGGLSDGGLVRLSRGESPVRVDRIPVGFPVDNVRRAPDGKVLVAGAVRSCDGADACEPAAARVAEVDTNTFAVRQLVDYKGNEFFKAGSVAIYVGDEIWIGGIGGSYGIARFPREDGLGGGPARAPGPPDEVAFVLPGSLVDGSEYAARRARVMDEFPDGVTLVPGATASVNEGPLRQNNDFFYFTGVEAPDAWLVVDGVRRESTLFLTLDEHYARGEGIPAELARDPAGYTGIEWARPVEEMGDALAEHARAYGIFYVSQRTEELPGMNTNEVFRAYQRVMTENPWDGRLTRELQLVERLEERYPGVDVRDAFLPIQVMRKVKSPAEVAVIREAGRMAVKAHLEVIRSTTPGMTEGALAALFRFVIQREGAQDLAYETIIMSGEHHPWGHYHRHDRTLEDGDFLILDAAPDYAYYNVDVSTSFPANGRFTPEQRALYELGEGIYRVCLDNYRPGTTFSAVGEQVRLWLEGNGYDATEDRFRGLIRWGCYNHPIGLATHDVMSSMTGPDEPLQPGFVFACDVNMPQTETLGIRIEDTIVITEDGFENLSPGLPRTVEEIEAVMREPGVLQRLGR